MAKQPEKIKVVMLKTLKGAEDGVNITEYRAGQEYEISPGLFKTFCTVGGAKQVQAQEAPTEEKAEVAAPENKAIETTPENKSTKNKRVKQ